MVYEPQLWDIVQYAFYLLQLASEPRPNSNAALMSLLALSRSDTQASIPTS